MATFYALQGQLSHERALWNPELHLMVQYISPASAKLAVLHVLSGYWRPVDDVEQATRVLTDRRALHPAWKVVTWSCSLR